MPFGVSQSAEWTDLEILKFPVGIHAIKSVVLDATDSGFGYSATAGATRVVVPAGTILKLSATNANLYVKYNGTGTIVGILGRPIDMLTNATASREPAPMYFKDCVFSTLGIANFTQYASALVADLGRAPYANAFE
jgi:hypothetical protein